MEGGLLLLIFALGNTNFIFSTAITSKILAGKKILLGFTNVLIQKFSIFLRSWPKLYPE